MANAVVRLTPAAQTCLREMAERNARTNVEAVDAAIVRAVMRPPPNIYWDRRMSGSSPVACDPRLIHYMHAAHVKAAWVAHTVETDPAGVEKVLNNYAASRARVMEHYRPQPLKKSKNHVAGEAFGWKDNVAGISVSTTKLAALEAFCLQHNVDLAAVLESLFLAANGPPTAEGLARCSQQPRVETLIKPVVSVHLRSLVSAIGIGYKRPTRVIIAWAMQAGNNERMMAWVTCTREQRAAGLAYMVEHPAWNTAPLCAREALWRL